MKNFVKIGEVLDYTADANILSGDLVIKGDLVGVAVTDIANGEVGSVNLKGVYKFPKVTGAITQGAKLYWVVADKSLTTTASGNTLVGVANKGAGSGDATAELLLKNGI